MRTIRELSRRKLRTTLTILGITIGIWALVVFSSMANKINALVSGGSDYYVGKIIVSDGSTGGIGIGVVPIDSPSADTIRGAATASAAVDPAGADAVRRQASASGFGMPKMIIGAVAGADQGLDTVRDRRRRRDDC